MNTFEATPVNPTPSLMIGCIMTYFRNFIVCGILLLICTITTAEASDSFLSKSYPLPLDEVEEVVTNWLEKDGFLLEKFSQNGTIIIHGKKTNEEWQVRLTPDSPLATKVGVQHRSSTTLLNPNAIWDRLRGYLSPPPLPIEVEGEKNRVVKDKPIPPHILNLLDAVVCVRADHRNKTSQFTGFFVDETGLILTTAHGLREKQVVRVMLYDGTETEATVLLKRTDADLAVLRIPIQSGNYVPIEKGRNLLSIGEEIFTMGCPLDLQGTIYNGRVNGPPRRMDGLPYWQVDMIVFQGSSGSPVFDANGNFVAVVKGKFRGTESVGFLIPLQTIMEFLQGSN